MKKIKKIRFEPFEILAIEQEMRNEIITLSTDQIDELKRKATKPRK